MRETRLIMGMPITVEVGGRTPEDALEKTFAYFTHVDERFSTYKDSSEVSRINRGELGVNDASEEMREVLALAEKTKQETGGYFDIKQPSGLLDPSGIVKGWAIYNAARELGRLGYKDFYIDAGGDIQSSGKNAGGEEWSVGIRHPFKQDEIIKVVYPRGRGVATSGSYERGAHIYNPHAPDEPLQDIVSVTVIGPNILEADRFATVAFAMGRQGIEFIEKTPELEGYAIDTNGIGTGTSGFGRYTEKQ